MRIRGSTIPSTRLQDGLRIVERGGQTAEEAARARMQQQLRLTQPSEEDVRRDASSRLRRLFRMR